MVLILLADTIKMLKCVLIHCVSHLFKDVISIMGANNNQRVQRTFLLTLSYRVNYEKLISLQHCTIIRGQNVQYCSLMSPVQSAHTHPTG